MLYLDLFVPEQLGLEDLLLVTDHLLLFFELHDLDLLHLLHLILFILFYF